MESIAPGTWPWLVLLAAIAGFVLGYIFGRPRMVALWFQPPPPAACPGRCNCGGINCNLPPPGAPPGSHTHCLRAGCGAGCTGGLCTLPLAHPGPHACPHGHPF